MATPRVRSAFAAPLAALVIVAPRAADAQTTTTATGPSVTQAQDAPIRYLNYGQSNEENLGTATRSVGLNPTGVNYADCVSDMTLGFPVVLSGFGVGNSDGMQIWASVLGTCIADSARGNPGPPSCWLVDDAVPLGSTSYNGSQTFPVRVQDLVGPQQAPPDPPLLVQEGAAACNAQLSYAAVDIYLWFVPLSGEGTFDPTSSALMWKINTDLVGPPAPTGVVVGAGQNLLTVSWTANNDSDTLGYDLFIDPPPGSAAQPSTVVVCPDAGSPSSADGAVPDAGGDASASSSSENAGLSSGDSGSGSDVGCSTVNVGQSGLPQGVCSSTVLGSAMVQDSGVAAGEDTGDASDEDDGAVDAASGDVSAGVGGIATIPCEYALDTQCTSGSPVYTGQNLTVTGETNTTKPIPGLTDGVTYAVAVSAVDNSGNPGPPSLQSAETCNYPAPVNDFFTEYRNAGGQAGGGYCALQGGTKLEASSGSPVGSSIAFAAAGAAALAAGRRRRRRSAAAIGVNRSP